MGRKTQDRFSAGVREVRERIAQWRQTREKRSPMPADLWDEAVALARRDGTYAIARALKINYQSLGKRVAEAQVEREVSVGHDGAFVEVSGVEAQLFGGLTPAGAVVELSTRDGVRLTIRLGQGEKLDLAGLLQGLCQHRD